MTDAEQAAKQGATDRSLNHGPAQTHTWSSDARNAYDNAFQKK